MSGQNNGEGDDISDNDDSFCDGSFNEDSSCVDEIDNSSKLQLELQKLKRELRKAKESQSNLTSNLSGVFNEDQISFLSKKPGSGRGMIFYYSVYFCPGTVQFMK